MTNSTIGKQQVSESFMKLVEKWSLAECLDYIRDATYALENGKISHMKAVYENAIEYVEQHCRKRFEFVRGQTDQ
jgi:hypothetical protein